MEVFKSLPQWLQDKIKENLEFEGSALQEALEVPQVPAKAKAKPAPKAKKEEVPEDDDDQADDGTW